MKNYNVKVENESKEKHFVVNVDSYDDFIEWFKLFTSFEKDQHITFEEISFTTNSKKEESDF